MFQKIKNLYAECDNLLDKILTLLRLHLQYFSIILVIFVSILIFLFSILYEKSFQETVSSLEIFFLDSTSFARKPFEEFKNIWKNAKQLSQLSDLKIENAILKQKLVLLSQIEEDNQKLRNLYHIDSTIPTVKFASVLAKQSQDYGYFYVNKGKNFNIRKNDLIIDNYRLIGRVVEVYDNMSKILHITHQKSKFPVYIKSSIPAIASGAGRNNIEILKFNAFDSVNIGDDVYVSYTDMQDNIVNFIPPIYVGTISKLSGSRIFISNVTPLHELTYVGIVSQ